MLNIGSHLSISNGFEAVGIQALEIGANTFQFFTRNPRGGAARKIDNEDIERLKTLMKNNGFSQIVAHAPYTMNLCSANIQVREFAYNTLVDDLNRMEYLPNNFYNLHPGSHTGQGTGIGISQIADALNRAIKPNMHTIVLLETMAGKGSEIGSKFEELRAIIDLVEYKDRIGVCFDTCHVFDAGYDIVSSLDGVLSEFDSVIGIDRLCAVHLNDTMNYLGCHKDRHEKIGMGAIGIDAFERIINHKYLRDLPFILETPNEIDGYSYEIALLKQKYYE